MAFARAVVLSLALHQAAVTATSYDEIFDLGYTSSATMAGYTPPTDVTDHANIDLDMTAINDAMGDGDYATANDIYNNGANSVKGSGYRTLAGFSKTLTGEDEWQMGATYWGEDTYADGIVSDALSGGIYTYMYQRSAGSCYSPGVSCNVEESACTSGYYYNPGYPSSYSGVCHCQVNCTATGTQSQYYDGVLLSTNLTNTQRSQIVSKGVAYINAAIYSLHELYSAIEQCTIYVADTAGYTNTWPEKALHYWDEGWAFYAGSQQETGSTSTGDLAYELAEKRCSDFNTCGSAGYVEGVDGNQGSGARPSLANRNMLALYNYGLVQIANAASAADCTALTTTKDEIVKQMVIPLIQGTIKYAYKSDPLGGASDDDSSNLKSLAEAWAFGAALIPFLNDVSYTAPSVVFTNLHVALGSAGAVPDGYAAVKTAIEGTYSSLGITCADVGEYYGMVDDSNYVACSGLTAGAATVYSNVIVDTSDTAADSEWPFSNIAGYAPYTNVVEHAKIDLDMTAINDALDGTDAGYTAAALIYTDGANSAKGTGFRTLSGFSKNLAGETEWDAGYAYWGSETYADDIVADAFDDADYAITPSGYTAATSVDLTDTQREQIIGKGVAYINAAIYSLHELYSALSQCSDYLAQGTAYAYDYPYKAVHYWDEGWAFYAGSAQAVGSTSTSDLAYELAEKRCTDYATCGASGTSSDSADRPSLVNRNLIYLYNLGLEQLVAGSCMAATSTKNLIVSQMTIPLVQGTLKYVYKSDPVGYASWGTAADDEKANAEGWAFAAALLPFVDACDSTVSQTLYDNINMGLGTAGMVPDGYVAVKTAIESTYACLGITCNDVGAYGSYWSVCSDSSTAASVYDSDMTSAPTAVPAPTVSVAVPVPTVTAADDSVSGASRGAISTAVGAFVAMLFAVMQL
jgi:hypothetical protein